jgi:hypothetical protein
VESRKRSEHDQSHGSLITPLFAHGLCTADLSRDRLATEQDHHAWTGQGPVEEKLKRCDIPAKQLTRHVARSTAAIAPADIFGQSFLNKSETVIATGSIKQQQG